MENKRCDTIMKNQRSIYQCMGKYIFAIIRSIIVARYFKEKGLAVIQQRFDEKTKSTWWGEVDPWITDDLYLHPCFKEYFDMRSGMTTNGLYPTVTIRQIMWALKMKPIKRERWETVFDRRDI